MSNIADSFCDTINHNLGEQKVTDLLNSADYKVFVIENSFESTDDENGTLEVSFSDGSKAKVEIHDDQVKAFSEFGFNAQPFVKVKMAGAVVYSNGTDVFVQFDNCKKTVRMSSDSHGEIQMTGTGPLKKYDEFLTIFK